MQDNVDYSVEGGIKNPMVDFNAVKNVGIDAAYKSAGILSQYLGELKNVQKKGPSDLVTDADIASQKQIINTIRSRYPEDDILAEEEGYDQCRPGVCQWIIDPLDGTTNFAHGIPLFSISIAYAKDDEIKVGLVLNPVTGELFSAIREMGASLNGNPISVSEQVQLSDSLLVTGFSYDVDTIIKPVMQRLEKCLMYARGIRRLGSAALDLCFVACGRFDGFWEQNLKPWDTAAGKLIAEEAGGRVTDFTGGEFRFDKNEILATNGHIHHQIRELLKT